MSSSHVIAKEQFIFMRGLIRDRSSSIAFGLIGIHWVADLPDFGAAFLLLRPLCVKTIESPGA